MNAPPVSPESPQGTYDGAVRRVRSRVLGRIAVQQTTRHLTVRSGSEGWHELLPGVRWKVLRQHERSLSYLVQLDPGAQVPAHRHPQDEECVVLDGELRIEDVLVLRAGDYHVAHAGDYHAAIRSELGALLFLRGAPPAIEQFL